jgi:hypothetical protein
VPAPPKQIVGRLRASASDRQLFPSPRIEEEEERMPCALHLLVTKWQRRRIAESAAGNRGSEGRPFCGPESIVAVSLPYLFRFPSVLQ